MTITIQELAKDTKKYIDLAKNDSILISANGEIVAELSSPKKHTHKTESLVGVLPADITLEEARTERLSRV